MKNDIPRLRCCNPNIANCATVLPQNREIISRRNWCKIVSCCEVYCIILCDLLEWVFFFQDFSHVALVPPPGTVTGLARPVTQIASLQQSLVTEHRPIHNTIYIYLSSGREWNMWTRSFVWWFICTWEYTAVIERDKCNGSWNKES